MPTKPFKEITRVNVARSPHQCIGRHLLKDVRPGRTLTARRKAEDFHIRRQRSNMQPSKPRQRSDGAVVPKMVEFIIHRQADSGAVGGLL